MSTQNTNQHSTTLKTPKECASIVRNQTFIVENQLSQAECINGNEPLNIYHDNFARFKICIINSEKKSAFTTIRVDELPAVFAKSKAVLNCVIMNQLNSAGKKEEQTAKAYTQRFSAGYLKGKTPAQVLLEDTNGLDTLRSQYEFLKKNVERYPKNRELMTAIQEAVQLFKENRLDMKKADSTPASSVELYNSGFRYNIRKQNSQGLYRIREMKIVWYLDKDYPVSVEIRNYDAPIEKKPDGTVNVKAKERKNMNLNVFNMTIEEWEYVKYMIQTNMRLFENSVGNRMISIANAAEKKNSAAYQKAVSQNAASSPNPVSDRQSSTNQYSSGIPGPEFEVR